MCQVDMRLLAAEEDNSMLKLISGTSRQIKKHMEPFQQLCIPLKKELNDAQSLRSKLDAVIQGNIKYSRLAELIEKSPYIALVTTL